MKRFRLPGNRYIYLPDYIVDDYGNELRIPIRSAQFKASHYFYSQTAR